MDGIDRELILAARENNLQEVRRLLRAGADVNAKDLTYGKTSLHWACEWGVGPRASYHRFASAWSRH
jgi:ankyrin repeat protein